MDNITKKFDKWMHDRLFSNPPQSVTPFDAYQAGRKDALEERQLAPLSDEWKEAVIQECISCHIGWDDANPRKTLHDVIRWNLEVALDPRVSSDAQALIDRGRTEAQRAVPQDALRPEYTYVETSPKTKEEAERMQSRKLIRDDELPPAEIIEAAEKVAIWFEERNIDFWKLGSIQKRKD